MEYSKRQKLALNKLSLAIKKATSLIALSRITIDFETRCELDIKKVGSYKYSQHPSCEVLMMSYSLTGKPEDTRLWRMGDRPPMGLFTLLQSQVKLNAFNKYFEFCIWLHVCVPKLGWPDIEHEDIFDTGDKCKALALPASLDAATEVMQVEHKKNADGEELIKFFCCPKKLKKGETVLQFNQPEDFPEKWERFCQYCIDDTKATIALDNVLPELTPIEQLVSWMTDKMNYRGIYIDMTAVRAAVDLADKIKKRYNEEASKLSGGLFQKCTQRAKVKEWLASKGFVLHNMQGDTITVAMRRDDLDPDVRRMLELYTICGSTASAKFTAMVNYVADDGRVHELLNYHKARTGRWGGKGIQIQNLPRPMLPKFVDYTELLKLIKRGNFEELLQFALDTSAKDEANAKAKGKTKWWKANPMQVLTSCLRAVICSMIDKHYKCADYSSIEARVLLWLAGDEKALEIFREGKDIYLDMASEIYKVPLSGLTKESEERPLGKEAILGCLTQSTLVLTKLGTTIEWCPIIAVTNFHLVWDGLNWVSCEGVIYQGKREVIELWGTTVTPEHLYLVNPNSPQESWVEAQDAMKYQKSERFLVDLPSQLILLANAVVSNSCNASALAGSKSYTNLPTYIQGSQPVATHVPKRNLDSHTTLAGTVFSKSEALGVGGEFSKLGKAGQQQNAYIAVEKVHKKTGTGKTRHNLVASNVEGCQKSNPTSTINPEGCLTTCTQDVQTTPNTTATIKEGVSQSANVGCHSKISGVTCQKSEGLEPHQCLTGQTTTKDTRLTTADSSRIQKATKTPVEVYDIKNAGSNNRFTILTDEGPMIVHNCGYGMADVTFRRRCDEVAGIKIETKMAKHVITTYRKKYVKVTELWKGVELAAQQAVIHPGRVTECNGTKFVMKKYGKMPILLCKFPSGHTTGYPYPKVKTEINQWGYDSLDLSYEGHDSKTHQWIRLHTYGGKLVENITQGVARDLMAFGMLLLELMDYYLVMTVHDEVVSEDEEDFGNLADFEELLCTLPTWAGNLPVTSEGWQDVRYRK